MGNTNVLEVLRGNERLRRDSFVDWLLLLTFIFTLGSPFRTKLAEGAAVNYWEGRGNKTGKFQT